MNTNVTLRFSNATGTLTLTIMQYGQISIGQSNINLAITTGAVSNLTVSTSQLSLSINSSLSGSVSFPISGSSQQIPLLVGGNFSPGTVLITWQGQMGGPETLMPHTSITIQEY